MGVASHKKLSVIKEFEFAKGSSPETCIRHRKDFLSATRSRVSKLPKGAPRVGYSPFRHPRSARTLHTLTRLTLSITRFSGTGLRP